MAGYRRPSESRRQTGENQTEDHRFGGRVGVRRVSESLMSELGRVKSFGDPNREDGPAVTVIRALHLIVA